MQLLDYYYEPPIPAMGTGSQYCLRWNNHRTNLLSAFENLLRQEAFTDVTLACEEGITLHAHRLVLAACSTYFSTLFAAAHSAQHPIIVLKDVKADDMRALLAYMYRGEVNVEQSALSGLLKVAEGLKVKGLVEDLATDAHPIPLLNHSQVAPASAKGGLGVSSPPVTPAEHRVPSIVSERRSESHYPFSTNSLCSPPRLPPPMLLSHSSPKRVNIDCPKECPLPLNIHSSSHPSFIPNPYYPRIPPSLEHRITPAVLEVKDFARETIIDKSEKEKIERPPRPASDDPRGRSPLSLMGSFQLHQNAPESPPVKRPRPFLRDGIISPTPILRTALAHTHGFVPDVSSLVSLANSMMPMSPLLSSRVPAIISPEVPRNLHDKKDQIEPSYGLVPPKKLEPLSDEESRPYSDTREDDVTERSGNGPAITDFSSYQMDSNTPSHYSNFVSYVPTPKPEWKRYKQYTKTDLMEAIEAVKAGMTALQASRKYKVPSRTLYDKIKKMGISTIPRRLPTKRSAPGDGSSDHPSLSTRPHSAGPYEQMSSSRDFYDQRPCSTEAQNDVVPSSAGESEKNGTDTRRRSPPPPPPPPIHHDDTTPPTASTRGSFSLVDRKVFDGADASPLDLTESESLIPSRQQHLEERA